MHDVRTNLYDCQHCKGEGTCRNGEDGCSCAACFKANELKRGSSYAGLICGACGGIGKSEPYTERLNNRVAPIVAITLPVVLGVLIGSSVLMGSEYTTEIISFSGSLLGIIVGFYFSNRIKGVKGL